MFYHVFPTEVVEGAAAKRPWKGTLNDSIID
jgi:hypothetical protein